MEMSRSHYELSNDQSPLCSFAMKPCDVLLRQDKKGRNRESRIRKECGGATLEGRRGKTKRKERRGGI